METSMRECLIKTQNGKYMNVQKSYTINMYQYHRQIPTTEHSFPVQIHTSVGEETFKELGAELKINKESPQGPVLSFDQLLVDQPSWIRDLSEFVAKEMYTIICKKIQIICKEEPTFTYLGLITDYNSAYINQYIEYIIIHTSSRLNFAVASYGLNINFMCTIPKYFFSPIPKDYMAKVSYTFYNTITGSAITKI